MELTGLRFLDSAKLRTIVQTLADQLESNQNLLFLNRVRVVNADDDEIFGKYKGQVYAADVVADDQEAVVYESGSFEFTTFQIPNIKMGKSISQNMLNRIARLSRNLPADAADRGRFDNWQLDMAQELVLGVRQRVNALLCAMMIDATSYNRLGIQLQNSTWGMPANLKITPTNAWDDAVNSTPITDMQVLITETAPDNYGEQYDRVTMSSRAFRYLTQSAEFQNRVKGELRYNFGSGELNVRDTGAMRALLANILGIEVEVYDGSFWERANNGAKSRNKVLPVNRVLFSSSADDNNTQAFDFANGVVTESIVGSVLSVPGFNGEAFGPIAYYEGNPGMNPPVIRAWSVVRGFPRKFRETATAVMTVGNASTSAWS